MEKEDKNEEEKKTIKENNINKIKLNYDYHSFENIIINQKPITLDYLLQNKEQNKNKNSNLLNNKNKNDIKKNSVTEISSNKNTEVNVNNKYGLYKDFIYDNDNDDNEQIVTNDKRYIQTTRNYIKTPSNRIKANINLIEKDFNDILKPKESLENKIHLKDLFIDLNEKNYNNMSNNNKKTKTNEETKDFESLEITSKQNMKKNRNKNNNSNTIINKFHENYLITNEDLDFNGEKERNDIKKEYKNLRINKSNPHLKSGFETDIFENIEDKFEIMTKRSRNNMVQDKFEKLYQEHFILKTKYDILKNNMNILQKKLKQKNYDISQMKKILLSNNQQINFLNTLKESNLKTLKDNEDLIFTLENAISNLNSKIIEYKNKLSNFSQNNYNILKKENESLKIYLNDRDKTIETLKSSLSFLTQNLDKIFDKTNYNENNEKLISQYDEKIKTLKEQMNLKIIGYNSEKEINLEEKFENFNKILEEKNSEIEKYKITIKEFNESINRKNIEINEIQNNLEKNKKILEEKEKELDIKDIKIKEMNNIIEKRNNEINDIKKILDMKNLEIEERKKKIDFQIISQSSLEYCSTVKKYRMDNNNKKKCETQKNFFKISNKKENNTLSTTSNIINSDNTFEKNNINSKFFIKKIKNSNITNKNHLNKELLFNDRSEHRIKTNYDYFNNDNYLTNEQGKSKRDIYNFNYRKYKSNKNFNTIIGNNLFINKSSNINSNVNIIKDHNKYTTPRLKSHLFNENDEDIQKIRYTKPKKGFRKSSPNLLLSTSTISVSQNENIKSITYLEKSTSNYEYIYSLKNSELLSFNLKQKKFEILNLNDNTEGIFGSYLSYYRQNKLQPLLLNTQKNFYIVMQKYIFTYDSSLNMINILAKTLSSHLNGKFILIENNLYLISGNNNTQCELYSLIMNKNKLLPSTNFPRINSGICDVNNEYIYIFFGQFCENSIERLNIKNLNYDKKWEIIKIKEINGINNKNIICLEKFISFLDDYNNIIIFGGQDYNNEKCNKTIFGFNLEDKSFSTIGKIDSCALYNNQHIKLDESFFSVFDENNGLHFFSKELDYHEIFNLN